jgi:hypothetical protein
MTDTPFFRRRRAIELPVLPAGTGISALAAGRTGEACVPETMHDFGRDADHEHDTK